MQKSIYLIFFLSICLSFRGFAQDAVLQNPSACGLNLPIADLTCPENSPFSSPNVFEIQVSGVGGTALGTDIYLNEVRLLIEHPWISDLNIRLRSPGGQEVQLVQNTGGNADSFGDPSVMNCGGYMAFQLAACQGISEGTPPYVDGNYRALEDFYAFNDGTTDPNGDWELLICDDLIEDTGILQFVELVFTNNNCPPIADVEIVSQDTTSIQLQMNPNVGCVQAIAEIGPPGFVPGTNADAGEGQVFLINCPSFTLTDLAADAEFELYVRRSCNASTFTANSCALTFQTACLPPVTTFIEGFTGDPCLASCTADCELSGDWRNTNNDDMNWLAVSGSTPTANTGPDAGLGGGGTYLYLEANGNQCATGAEAVLTGPCILLDKQGSDDCHWSFYYHMQGVNIGQLRAEVSTDGGLSWITRWERSGTQGSDWQHAYVSLADYPDGSNLQLRLVGTKGNGVFGDIAIDDIRLHGSQNLGYPTDILYTDADGDGFGDAMMAQPTCRSTAPMGFVFNGDDCDDTNSSIFPGAPEIPCNNIDENCNAATRDDDSELPAPLTQSDTICSGETAILTAITDPAYTVFWYADSLRASGIIGADVFSLSDLPPNNTPFPQQYTYYAEVTNFVCNSIELVPATVVVFPNPAPQIGSLPSLCPGDDYNLTTLQLTDLNFTGATTTFHSAWPTRPENELTDLALNLLTDSTFYYQLRSSQSCTVADSFRIDLNELPQISFSPADSFSLCRQSLDTVQALVSGGAGNYAYLWENGLTQSRFPVEGSEVAGNTQVIGLQVTDASGCSAQDSVLVTTTNSIDSLRVSSVNVSTCSGNDGGITIIPLNGLPPFAYQWRDEAGNTGQGMGFMDTVRIADLPQNAYRVTLTDSSPTGCSVRLRNIRVQGPGFQLSDTEVETPSCVGGNDGALRLDISGNTSPLSFNWSTGGDTDEITGLSAGTYSVTISNGTCTMVESYVLSEPDSIRVIAKTASPSCSDADDGSLEVTIFGGTPAYAVEWDNGSILPLRENLVTGNYPLRITDQNNCVYLDTILLSAPSPLTVEIDTLRPVSCAGADDAFIQLKGTGGTPPYSYQWADGSTASLRVSLAPGEYPLTLTDAAACSTLDTIFIAEPELLVLNISNTTFPICQGDFTGEVVLAANGGTLPYTYKWNDGVVSANPVRTGLGVGEYEVYVEDARACTSERLTVELLPQSNLSLTATLDAPTCVGLADGAISLTLEGQAPFDFDWSTGDDSAMLTDLPVGSYNLRVTDARSCVIDTVLELTAPQVFVFDSRVVQPSCFEVNDGIIDQSFVETGTAPFQFFWNDASQHVDRMFMGPGDYQFTVTDDIGCAFVSDTFRLFYPEPLALEVLEQGGIQCAGDTSGYFETQASGGTAPYNYSWSGTGREGSSIYELEAGAQRLIVTDDRACTLDTLLQLADPPLLNLEVELNVGNVCNPDDPDVLLATASGGSGPYNFLWNNRTQNRTLIDPLPGDYIVTATDANGCVTSFGTVKVQEKVPPLVLDSFRVEQVSCFAGDDAVLTAFTSGGSGQLRYHFTPTYIEETSADSLRISGISFDNSYSVTVTDLRTGCEVDAGPITGVQPDPLTIERDSFSAIKCFGGSDGAVFVEVFGGTSPYSYRWTNDAGELVSTERDLRFASADIYHLLTTDRNGCTTMYSDSNIVNLGQPIFIADTLITPAACRGEPTGSIDLRIDGGSPPYTYQWSTSAETEDVGDLRAGLYSLTVTDSDTCRVIFPPLSVPESLTSIEIASTLDSVSCFGGDDGRIAVTVSGGGGPTYQYAWRRDGILLPSLVGPIVEGLSAADYELAVTDTNACTQQFVLPLEEPELLVAQIENNPFGTDNLSAQVEGGTPPYRFLWSTGDTIPVLSELVSGDYQLLVLDDNDCEVTTNFILTSDQGLSLSASDMLLYPNPVQTKLHLQWQGTSTPHMDMVWRVYNALGHLVSEGVWANSSVQQEINVANWPSGMYSFQLYQAGQPVYVRLFVVEGN